MKKLYTTSEYIKRNTKRAETSLSRRLASKEKLKAFRKFVSGEKESENKENGNNNDKVKENYIPQRIYQKDIRPPILAPTDFRLVENTQECLQFFRDIRSEEYTSHIRNIKFVRISLSNVTQIDYGTISILTAISDDLKFKKVNLQGNFPMDAKCR
jgi:hypothetical protein